MTTHFIQAEVPLQDSALALQEAIEAELEHSGEPLRWAITEVDQQMAHIEAVVTRDLEPALNS
jgi:hypothetical protein